MILKATRTDDLALNFSLVEPGIPMVKNIGSGNPQTIRKFSEYWWEKFHATGKLLPGAIPYRENEIMSLVPELDKRHNPL